MSNNLTNFPYTNTIVSNLAPVFPGAYIFRGIAGLNGMIPIYTSIPSFADNGTTDILNDKNAQVLVLPGFALQLYTDASYGTLNATIDNSGGTEFMFRNSSPANTSSSCKLFYNFPTGYAELASNLFKSVTLTITPTLSPTSTITYNGLQYRIYQFTSTSVDSSFSITDTTGSGMDVLCLLIGGGGGGGSSNSNQSAGAGGGGAGAFVTSTIRVTPGYTFSVRVGNGGTGGNASVADGRGNFGNSSSINRFLNGTLDVALNAGGGGGGAGTSYYLGNYNTALYGSTGGNWGGNGTTQSIISTATANSVSQTANNNAFNTITSSVFAGGQAAVNGGGGGGGGAGAVGSGGSGGAGGPGGAGKSWPVNGSTYAGGGGGNNYNPSQAGTVSGGSGGGGAGGLGAAGTTNTGSGGGATWTGNGYIGGTGGSGICIFAVPLYRLSA